MSQLRVILNYLSVVSSLGVFRLASKERIFSTTLNHLLEQVFRLGGLPHGAQQVPIQAILVPGNQFRESVQVASAKPDHIRIHCHKALQR